MSAQHGTGMSPRGWEVTQRPLPSYELRCVVWNTRDVEPGDINAAGQRMSDIYVTG